ncbi:unnamed protein product [Prorocentrum cordatum]|uniref:Uncharacterized protein n=1 Tax=Prorocentrum cordatum TaxID=2364126 RepID=A0ABN9YCZ3_9DINO|nr:unnamed protein product [Polarella glacialis]
MSLGGLNSKIFPWGGRCFEKGPTAVDDCVDRLAPKGCKVTFLRSEKEASKDSSSLKGREGRGRETYVAKRRSYIISEEEDGEEEPGGRSGGGRKRKKRRCKYHG